jgi:hypothetical protein
MARKSGSENPLLARRPQVLGSLARETASRVDVVWSAAVIIDPITAAPDTKILFSDGRNDSSPHPPELKTEIESIISDSVRSSEPLRRVEFQKKDKRTVHQKHPLLALTLRGGTSRRPVAFLLVQTSLSRVQSLEQIFLS